MVEIFHGVIRVVADMRGEMLEGLHLAGEAVRVDVRLCQTACNRQVVLESILDVAQLMVDEQFVHEDLHRSPTEHDARAGHITVTLNQTNIRNQTRSVWLFPINPLPSQRSLVQKGTFYV